MKRRALLFIVIFVISINFQSCAISMEDSSRTETPQHAETTEASEAKTSSVWIDLQSVQNARQLGGYSAKNNRVVIQNAILRAGELADLTNDDKEKLVNEYRPTHIIDLRDEVEIQNNPDPLIEGAQYHNLVVWPRESRERMIQESTTDKGFDSELYVKNYYTSFALAPAAIKAYKEMFEVLLENESGSVLIHCVHGKDRTGIAVTLILSALGAEWDVIEQEYLLSGSAGSGSMDIYSLRYYRSVIEKNYGSMEKYLESEMDLDEKDIIALREKYTLPVE